MAEPAPDFERLRTALLRGQPDRVPIAELGVHPQVMAAYLGRPIDGPATAIEFWRRAGYDFITAWPHYNWNPAGRQPREGFRRTVFRRSVYSDEPEERQWRGEKAGVITSPADFKAHEWPTKDSLDTSSLRTYSPLLPPGMKMVVVSSMHEFAVELMGTETLLLGIYDQPELVAQVYSRVGELIAHMFAVAAESPGVGALWVGDDLAYTEGLFFAPGFIREHILPWYRQIVDIARAHDLPILFHSDGDIRPILPDLEDVGFHAIHPVEPKAMDIVELKRDWGHTFCLLGNIDLCYTLPRGTPAEVRDEVKLRLRQAGPGGGYCLGSANSVPEYVPVENYRAMVEAALEFGTYPLQG